MEEGGLGEMDKCCDFSKYVAVEGLLVINEIVPLSNEVEINYCMFCGTKLSPPAEETKPAKEE
jgi:hypothetical protein